MKLKKNLIFAIVGVFALGFLLVSWRLWVQVNDTALAQASRMFAVQKKISAAVIEQKIENINKSLLDSATQEVKSRFASKKYTSLTPQSLRLREASFMALSFLVPSQTQLNSWQALWNSVLPEFGNELTVDVLQQIVKDLEVSTNAKSLAKWQLVKGLDNRKYVAIFKKLSYLPPKTGALNSPEGEAILVGLLSIESFSKLSKHYKADLGEVYLVDQLGIVVAASKVSHVGQSMKAHPLFELAQLGRPVPGKLALTEFSSKPVIGYYKEVENTNLFILNVIPLQDIKISGFSFWVEIFLVFTGLGLIAFVLFNQIIARESIKISQILPVLESVAESRPIKIPQGEPGITGKVMSLLAKIQSDESIGESAEQVDVEMLNSKIETTRVLAFKQFGMGLTEALRVPISSILGHVQLIMKSVTDEEAIKHCEVIQRETRKSREVIENLGKFSGIEVGNLKFIELRDCVTKALATRQSELKGKGVQVHKKLEVSSMVKVNALQMQAVVEKLLDNSIEAMTWETGLDLFVEVVERNDKVLLIIKDSGVGIGLENQSKMLEPFFSTKNNEQNPGLGLTVAAGLVRHFHGSISFQSKEGVGTQFIIELPRVTSTMTLVEENLQPAMTEEESFAKPSSLVASKAAVLDDPEAAENSEYGAMKLEIESLDLSPLKESLKNDALLKESFPHSPSNAGESGLSDVNSVDDGAGKSVEIRIRKPKLN